MAEFKSISMIFEWYTVIDGHSIVTVLGQPRSDSSPLQYLFVGCLVTATHVLVLVVAVAIIVPI